MPTANKPMGAAFSHARAVGGGKDKQHRLANAYLRRRGHEPIGKGVLDQWRALSTDERVNEAVLRAKGISPAVARALAMRATTKAADAFAGVHKGGPGSGPHKAGDGADGDKRLAEARASMLGSAAKLTALRTMMRGRQIARDRAPVKKADYHRAYIDAAKAVLPPDVHDQLHRKARASAGGHGSRRAKRGRKDAKTGELLAASKALRASLKAALTDIDKSGPTLAELDAAGHAAPAPRRRGKVAKAADALVAQAYGLQPVAKRAPVAKAHVLAQMADAYVDAAYAPAPEGPGSFASPTRTADALHAQEVIAATDWGIGKYGVAPDEARALGEAQARLTPGLVSSTGTVSDYAPAEVSGLNLDIGSGYAREAGYIGLDLHAYDHGTLVHDVALGLPFSDASARSVRLVNTGKLHGVNTTELLAECARVLKADGRMLYQGPLTSQPAGFATASDELLDGVHRAVWVRQEHAVQHDDNSEVVHKRERVEVVQPCRVLKKDAHQQLVYGVVLSPNEADSQNDVMDAVEIERTAHQFLRDARVVGHEHNEAMDGASVVESYIAPQDLTFEGGQYGPQTVPKGSWVLAVHVSDPEHWQSVLDGAFTGFSVGGWGERDPVS